MDTKSTVKISGEIVPVDPNLIFQRLVTAGVDSSSIMNYELCTFPPALFASRVALRTSNKATLAQAMWSDGLDNPGPQGDINYILDGGALLHRIPWTFGITWNDIAHQYVTYVLRRYKRAVVVFDGYLYGPSTKDSTHLRRSNSIMSTAVMFTGEMKLQSRKEEFLANKENKQRFIKFLGDKLERAGVEVIQAAGDADLSIAKAAVASSDKCDTILVGDDTDLLVLLLYHAKDMEFNIFFKPQQKNNAKRPSKCWNIRTTRAKLGNDVCNNILFIHSILGCDTTSFPYGIGKRVSLMRMRSPFFKQQAIAFASDNSCQERIIEAGEQALVSLYGGEEGEAINGLRLRRFCEKTYRKTTPVHPQVLPPTSNATKYHSLRVYYQVQTWMSEVVDLDPLEWGWEIVGANMLPIAMDIDPAPQHILEMIRCNCKSGCYNLRCSCRKNNIECSLACGECRGSCANSSQVYDPSDDED
ncbi:uncharacterized protein LOC106162148 [Lingula anatina]|uniref:Uncharacterized protein LOC106162148 n=1 Tax=Lingula anatina TaxID=7574 RepID=A0A1S3IBH9_LINAN|nr:uncharacterized protein LOC106162148 [Lingula anatina]|eukprot:XP_013394769.1 uncharacterized protein LOC106162148 [Lingula anatina]